MSYQNIDKPSEAPSAAPGGYPTSSSGVSGGSVSSSFFNASSVTEIKTIIRGVQVFTEIVCFSCVAGAIQWTGVPPSWNTFLLFVGVMGLVLDLAFIIIYTYNDSVPSSWEARLPVVELAITAIWALFFFCGSIAYVVNVNKFASEVILPGVATARAGAAFGFFSWLFWTGSAALAFQRYRSGGGTNSAPVHYNDL